MAVPEYHRFFRPALELLKDGRERRWQEIEAAIADQWRLSKEDREELVPSGQRTRLADRVQWALTYLRQAGLLKRTGRGVNQITSRGLEFLKRAPEIVTPQDLMEFPEFVEFQSRSKSQKVAKEESKIPIVEKIAEESHLTPEEAIEQAYNEHKTVLAQEILERVKAMPPTFFEKLIVRLMLSLGYGGAGEDSGKALGRTGDEGVDGLIKQDKLGLESIYLQAKRLNNSPVGRPAVQAFVGALSGQGATKGVFITTSTFTKDAFDYAQANKSFKLSLIDGLTLAQLMIDYDLGVSLVQRYDVKRVDSDFFSEE